jgi:hypothetical protein
MCKWGTDKKVKLFKKKEYSGKRYIMVDECIADIIQALNNYGIETVCSCCGHFKGDGRIDLVDGRILIIKLQVEQ